MNLRHGVLDNSNKYVANKWWNIEIFWQKFAQPTKKLYWLIINLNILKCCLLITIII